MTEATIGYAQWVALCIAYKKVLLSIFNFGIAKSVAIYPFPSYFGRNSKF